MKQLFVILIPAIIFLASCKGGENKADNSTKEPEPTNVTPDTTGKNATPTAPVTTTPNDTAVTAPADQPKLKSDKKKVVTGQTRGFDDDPDDIVKNINEHLVSNAQFKAVPGGGITDCIVTVTNTLANVSFQKVLVEVTIKKEDNVIFKKDYYTLVNIEPGMSKVIKVPNQTQGASVQAAVIKIKSTELTNGEFVLAGSSQ